MSPSEHPVRPRFGKIPAAVTYSSICRSRLYEIAAMTPGLFKKAGASTIVDFDVLDRVLDQLPNADLKARQEWRK
jgi:hypothetical protein